MFAGLRAFMNVPLIVRSTPKPPERSSVSTLRQLVTEKAATAAARATSNETLAAAQADNAQKITLDQSADVALSSGVSTLGGPSGFVIDPTVGPDGNFTLYVKDQSSIGYHTVVIAGVDAAIPVPAPVPPVEPLPA